MLKNNLINILIIIALYSCTGGNMGNNKKIFYYNESKGIASLDPAFARNQAVIWVVSQLYNGLVQLDDSLNVVPSIAKKYFVSKDGKEYTFILRDDVFFQDNRVFHNGKGRRVNAYDFEFSFNRIIDSSVASPGRWIFSNVDKSKGNMGFFAENDSVFKIYLKKPLSSFIGILTMPYCYVVPHEAVEYYGKDFRSNPVGTGPFYLKLWVEGEKLIMRKNENYFEKDCNGNKLPYLDGIVISFVVDKQSEFMQFMTGRIDFISGVNPGFKDELLTANGELNPKYNDKFKMYKCPYLNIEYLGIMVDTNIIHSTKNPLCDINFRKAINLAIDRQKLVYFLRNNIGSPANHGFVPQGFLLFDETPTKGFEYDPDSAIKLLKKTGLYNTLSIEPFTIYTSSDYLDVCEYIQHELEKINISCNIEVVSGIAYREMLANSKMQVFRASWIADYPDPENFFALFYSKNFCPNGPNYTHFKNAVYDLIYENALTEQNILKRNLMYHQLDSIIIENAIVVPLFYDNAVRFSQKNVYGLKVNPLNFLNLSKVYKN